METKSTSDPTFPEEVRARSAHVLAGLVALQGLAALGSYGWLVVQEGRDPVDGLGLYFLAVGVISFLAAILEWMRNRFAESVATVALLLSFGLTLAAVLAGLWYLVPFVGLTTIAAIFGLVDRFAVRDESKHQPKH